MDQLTQKSQQSTALNETHVQCPRCHSSEISHSRTKRIYDFLMQIVGLRPFRCMECRKRFYLAEVYKDQIKQRRRWRRTARVRSRIA